MKDLIGQSLKKGDKVAVAPKNYRGLVIATIKDFTPKKVRLVYINTWNYGKPGHEEEYLVPPDFIVRTNNL